VRVPIDGTLVPSYRGYVPDKCGYGGNRALEVSKWLLLP
jgi:hypothetical protein